MSAGVITIAAMLVLGVLQIPLSLMRLAARRRAVPLAQRNQTRAGVGAALGVLALGLAVHPVPLIEPIRFWLIGGLAAFGLLFLVVGIHGAQGARFDVMHAILWASAAIGCVALLVYTGMV